MPKSSLLKITAKAKLTEKEQTARANIREMLYVAGMPAHLDELLDAYIYRCGLEAETTRIDGTAAQHVASEHAA